SPDRPLALDDSFNSVAGQIRILPIPKIGEGAGGGIPSSYAVAAHPKDAVTIFEHGIHRLVASPGIWFGKIVVIAPVTPMRSSVRRTIAAEHSRKAAFPCGEPHVAGA